MDRSPRALTVRLAVLGVFAFGTTFFALRAMEPHSPSLQALIISIHNKDASALASSPKSMCQVPTKNIGDEVFFVSCAGYF